MCGTKLYGHQLENSVVKALNNTDYFHMHLTMLKKDLARLGGHLALS